VKKMPASRSRIRIRKRARAVGMDCSRIQASMRGSIRRANSQPNA
jgi:hypothetical protein